MIFIETRQHSLDLMKDISEIALNKEVYKELGYPVFSDINHIWTLAYWNNKLVGFCASINKGSYISFSHDYVLKEYRNKGIYTSMFMSRISLFDKEIRATATKKSLNTFLEFGFEEIRKTKNYTFLIKKR